MTTLRQVLAAFENAATPISLHTVARALQIEPALLESMITFWIQRGNLRVVNAPCITCGLGAKCPFAAKLPCFYEFVRNDNPPVVSPCHGRSSKGE